MAHDGDLFRSFLSTLADQLGIGNTAPLLSLPSAHASDIPLLSHAHHETTSQQPGTLPSNLSRHHTLPHFLNVVETAAIAPVVLQKNLSSSK
jgi:hypothetical protein